MHARERLIRILIRLAMRAYPSSFRGRFGDDIAHHVQADRQFSTAGVIGLLKDGLLMRIDDFVRDLTYALSRLRRAPLFVAVVTLTFALGIGINVAVFSAFNAVVLRPLPFPHSDRLVTISKRVPGLVGPLSQIDIAYLQSRLHTVTSVAGMTEESATVFEDQVAKNLSGAQVSPSFFGTIGATPELGRMLEDQDGAAGRRNVVISDRLWHELFNGDPSVIGKPLSLDGTSYTIVGVTLPDMQTPNPFPGQASLKQPDYFTAIPNVLPANAHIVGGTLGVIASLRPGSTLSELNAELALASTGVQAMYPHTGGSQPQILFSAQPLAQALIGPAATSLRIVLLAVLAILIAACANAANLITARWSARQREIAIRRALGATNGRIARQLLVETGLLAFFGGLVGVAFAYVALRFIPLAALDSMPRANAISIDGMTLLYALLMVCMTIVLAGLAPVISLNRVEVQQVLGSAGRSGDFSRGHKLRSGLVVAEVAIALALVISSVLVVRSFVTLLKAPLDIRTDNLYVAGAVALPVDANPALYGRFGAQTRELLARVQALPGVESASVSLGFPLSGAFGASSIEVSGKPCLTRGPFATRNSVSPDYFRTLGISLSGGRAFTNSDTMGSQPVAIVSQSFAKAFFGQGEAVGQHIRVCGNSQWLSIVGVAPDLPQSLDMPPIAEFYTPLAQAPPPVFFLLVHASNADLASMRSGVQAAYGEVFPEHERPELYTVPAIVDRLTKPRRSAAALLGALSLVPLLLALFGTYGVVSFSVGLRSREFGIRRALGARSRSILLDVLRRSLSITAVGVAIGTVLAALDARVIQPYLTAKPDLAASYAGVRPQVLVSPLDPWTFGLLIALFFVCAAVASLIPALRATQVDPAVALRYE